MSVKEEQEKRLNDALDKFEKFLNQTYGKVSAELSEPLCEGWAFGYGHLADDWWGLYAKPIWPSTKSSPLKAAKHEPAHPIKLIPEVIVRVTAARRANELLVALEKALDADTQAAAKADEAIAELEATLSTIQSKETKNEDAHS